LEILRWKARLSVLWLTMAIGTAAAMFLSLLTPGKIEEVIAGEWGGMELSEGMLAIYAIFFLIPMVVAILCLTMENSRWLNFIVGIIWALWFIYQIIYHATEIEGVYIANWVMLAAGIVISAIIVWLAWRWPKAEA
jgi:hypothetical protein